MSGAAGVRDRAGADDRGAAGGGAARVRGRQLPGAVRRRRGRSGQRAGRPVRPVADLRAGRRQLPARTGRVGVSGRDQRDRERFRSLHAPRRALRHQRRRCRRADADRVGGTAGDTWARYAVDAPGGAIPPNVYDETDAVYAAANYLHATGAPGDWPAALYAYNHAGWYVAQVQQLAQRYAQTAGNAITAPARPRRPGASPRGRPRRDRRRGSFPMGSPPPRRTLRRRSRPRSRPATGSSTPPTAPSASRTC